MGLVAPARRQPPNPSPTVRPWDVDVPVRGASGTIRAVTSVIPSRTIDSPARSRTRRAILAAAATVLARDRTATLAEVADAAEVGRSTLHRYFPDREELVRAVVADSFQVLAESVQQAALDRGPPADAVRRLVAATMDTGDRLLFLFGDPRVRDGFDARRVPDASPAVLDLIARGQAAGVLDPRVSPGWVRHVLWALVYTGCEEVASGRMHRHAATAAVIHTLENGVGPPRTLER
ncbi:MAG: TetR family transcriptional regulator [Micromonosporaceae bacterium]|nr:TetR family transcriptional regulator [Micromonosporaceae bacterium]